MTEQLQKRMSTLLSWLTLVAIVLACAAPVSAQTPESIPAHTPDQNVRTFMSVNGGLRALTGNLDSHQRPADTLFDLSGGVHVARNLWFGVGVSRSRVQQRGDASGYIRPGDLSVFDTLARRSTAIHFQALKAVPVKPSLSVTFFGGPTLFNSGRVATPTFTTEQSNSTLGFSIGADVAYYFSRSIGVGWLARYGRGTVELPATGGLRHEDVNVGGLRTGFGLRVRF